MPTHFRTLTIPVIASILALAACGAGSDSADTTSIADTGIAEAVADQTPTPASPNTGSSSIGVDQMPATAKVTVTGPQGNHQWNGSWNITSNRLGCGVLTYPRMLNVDIADEDNTRGDFQQLSVGSNEAPDVGGSTSRFSITLSLDRPGPNLSIQPGSDAGDSGTLAIVESANGNSRVTFSARDNRGIQVDGEFTCVPRA